MDDVNVRQFIDERPVSKHQFAILFLTFLVVAFDGLDVTVIGLLAPEIIRDWGISKTEMGTVLSSVFVGMAIGAAIAGPISDRYGRKLVLVASIFWLGTLTFLSAFSPNIEVLLALRSLTGLGLGAAIPAALALVAEYAPKRQRSLFVTICFSGYTVGATLCGFLAAWLISSYGWRVTLGISGILPMLLGVALLFLLPESVAFLALKQRVGSIPGILLKIDPQVSFSERAKFWLPVVAGEESSSLRTLFSPKYAVTAVMLSLAYFLGVLVTYVIMGWLPAITRDAGFSVAQSSMIIALFNLAGPVGAISFGAVMDRLNPQSVLAVTFTTAGLLLASISIIPLEFATVCVTMLVLGFFHHGSMAGLQALAPQSFPIAVSATGVSTMHAVGRLGAIISGVLGSVLISLGWEFGTIFIALAFPILLCAASMAVIGITASRKAVPATAFNPSSSS
ncbi:hypothetical protein L905_11925 [Agrobacterium sp. TS43]|uniref:MFS transporter n=1 Tax=Agrobacterium TaxID=357 RepID=UPI0004A0D1CA|nr:MULTISPECIES: aromatic acid/H+ symport family MFS transporter [Agrobacterium]KDR86560.1 hypothetical protein K538_09895 [Agrobacterium tumefaciens GW4]KVK46723.1 hypothetical protein L904_22885 [Agrobacterium sp. LY4]KVK46830.1 hypothetical protein L903_22825 [Agrobacterium sp. JL28]KVK61151.1 hypothetical protein L906_21935 [Agrobacterium sp. TS45]KVK66281.1 hypothetical protein L907_21895 [Agrobacterium sp. C13]